jgi:fucose permease
MATAVLMFLYVGVENSVAGWLPSYSLRTFPLGQHMGAAVQTTFWAALLAGRLSAPLALRKLRPVPLVQTGIMVALVGIGLIVLVPLRTATFAGAAVAGAGLAVILPTAVAVIVDKLGSAAHAITGVLFAFAGLGGATLPATVGYISGHTGSLRLGLASSIFATLAMLVCQLWISRWANTPHAISASAA